MHTPFSAAEDLTALAASCYPLARFGATCIEVDLLDFLQPTQRRCAEAVMIKLRNGALFDKGILAVLHDLACLLDVKIVEDTVAVPLDGRSAKKGWDSWQDGNSQTELDNLADAQAALLELYASLAAVHDLINAEEAVQRLRASR